jgi:hypothetical protein
VNRDPAACTICHALIRRVVSNASTGEIVDQICVGRFHCRAIAVSGWKTAENGGKSLPQHVEVIDPAYLEGNS